MLSPNGELELVRLGNLLDDVMQATGLFRDLAQDQTNTIAVIAYTASAAVACQVEQQHAELVRMQADSTVRHDATLSASTGQLKITGDTEGVSQNGQLRHDEQHGC